MKTNIHQLPINIKFFNGAASIYGDTGLQPSTPYSAGIDLKACFEAEYCIIAHGERKKILTGIAIEPKEVGYAGFVYSRSGLGAVKGLIVAQGVGIIDADYRGEVAVFLLNTTSSDYVLQRGERIAQIVFQKYSQPLFSIVEELGVTSRGSGGFGHTGKK